MDKFYEIIKEMDDDQFNEDLGSNISVGDKVREYLDELCIEYEKLKNAK